MKTLNKKTQMKKLMFGALTALVMMTTACSKSSSSPQPPPPPPAYPAGCVNAACTPGPGAAGGQLLYSGQTTGSTTANAQFQVYGTPSGDGVGSVSGTIQIGNWLCANGGNLSGTYQISGQSNTMVGGQYSDYGQMTSVQVYLQIDPGTHSGPGLFSITIPACQQVNGSATRFDMNF